jgi:hypothetical protein
MTVRPEDGADNSPRKAGRREGHRRKDAAHAVLDARRERFLVAARRVLLIVGLERGKAFSDDWRDVVKLPAGIDPVCFGAVPKPLALAGIIRRAGFVVTSRPEAHGRPVSVWELIDRDAALQWLADHPEPPDDEDSPPTAGEPSPVRPPSALDTAAETPAATLLGFGRNDRAAGSTSPGQPSAGRAQQGLLSFDVDTIEGNQHAA